MMATGGTTWHGFWKNTIHDYQGFTFQQKHDAFANLRTDFQEATLDFVQLQAIDYRKSFSCSCGCSNGIVVDGITVGFHRHMCRLEQPWAANKPQATAEEPPPPPPPPVYGSLSTERSFVSDRHVRATLMKLCDTTGISSEDYDELKQQLLEEKSDGSGLVNKYGPELKALLRLAVSGQVRCNTTSNSACPLPWARLVAPLHRSGHAWVY